MMNDAASETSKATAAASYLSGVAHSAARVEGLDLGTRGGGVGRRVEVEVEVAVVHRGVHVAGAHAVDADAGPGHIGVEGEGAGEAEHRVLRCGVDGEDRVAAERGHRRRVDDAAACAAERITSTACRQPQKTPPTLTDHISSSSSGVTVNSGCATSTPALLWTKSSEPNVATHASMAARIAAGSSTSVSTAGTCAPRAAAPTRGVPDCDSRGGFGTSLLRSIREPSEGQRAGARRHRTRRRRPRDRLTGLSRGRLRTRQECARLPRGACSR